MRKVKQRLSYANVMSTLAVFMVLAGGTAVAVKLKVPKNSVKSKQIKNRAIQSVDVNPQFRAPYLRVSGTVSQAKARAVEARARTSITATKADTAGNSGSRVNVSAGAVEAFMTSPPFTLALACHTMNSPSNSWAVGLVVSSSTDGWFVSSQPYPFDAEQPVQVNAVAVPPGEFRRETSMQIALKDSNGQVTSLNLPTIGRELDGTCWIQSTATGTTPTPPTP